MVRLLRVGLVVVVVLSAWVSGVLAAPPQPSTSPPVVAAPALPPSPYPGTYVVQPKDTLTRIALWFGTTVWAIAQANNILDVNYIRIGQVLVIPGSIPVPPTPVPCQRMYVVQPGDTLYKIAWRYGTSIWVIVRANGIANPNYIRVGQTLFIPC